MNICFTRLVAHAQFLRMLLVGAMLGFVVPTQVRADDQAGVDGRIGHIALPALGRDEGLTHVEAFPYAILGSHTMFGDFRGFVTNAGELGTNLGLGYRFLEPYEVAYFGVSGWYDADQTTGDLFQQLGLNLEARTELGALTSNFYFPIGDTEQELGRTLRNTQFDGNQIRFDVDRLLGEALNGADVTLSLFMPGDFALDHQIEVSAGWYTFRGDHSDDINGFKLGVQGYVTQDIMAQVGVTDDDTFGTNVTVGAAWRFGTQPSPTFRIQDQLRRFVDRNYNVIVGQKRVMQTNATAMNAESGLAFVVQHVGNGSTSGDGTVDNPWSSIAEAQAAGGDFILVHSGTSLTENVILGEGQTLIGEGMTEMMRDASYGLFEMPTATGGTALPTILNSSGDAVTLASNSRIDGFQIISPNGRGIVADEIENFFISNVTIESPGGDGVYIDNSTGGAVSYVSILDGGANGLHLVGTDGELDFSEISIDGVDETGVLVDGGIGEITFHDSLSILNATNTGMSVKSLTTLVEVVDDEEEETPGRVFVEDLAITGADGATGVEIEDVDGIAFFQDLNVSTTNGTSLRISDSSQVVTIDGILAATNAPVIDIENSTVDMDLTSISADGGDVGVKMHSMTGELLVFGETEFGSGGVIKNTKVAVDVEDSERVGFQGLDLEDNEVIAEVKETEAFELSFARVSGTTKQLINTKNLKVLEVVGSTFEDNPIAEDVAINFEVDQTDSYVASLIQNEFMNTPGSIFSVSNESATESSTLRYEFIGNQVELAGSQSVAAGVNWKGAFGVHFANNLISGDGAGQIGLDVVANESVDLAEILAANSTLSFAGSNATAVRLDLDAPSVVEISSVLIQFDGSNGTGVNATFREETNALFSGNQITDFSGGATGILLPSVADGSSLTFDGNFIDLSNFDSFVDRGIILSEVLGDNDPLIFISSSISNTIRGATTPMFFPSTGVTGQILTNE